MRHPAVRWRTVAAVGFNGFALESLDAQPDPAADAQAEMTVMVQMRLAADAEAADETSALNKSRAVLRKQPSYVSDVLCENSDVLNVPHFVR